MAARCRSRPLPLTEAEKPVALALAQASRHPLARALAEALGGEGVTAVAVTGLTECAGLGIEACFEGRQVRLGRPDWAGAEAAAGNALQTAFDYCDGAARLLTFSDAVRPDAPATMARLRTLGLRLAIISGDRADAVDAIAGRLAIVGCSGLTPGDKCAAIAQSQAAGHRVLMVGDGLNDGPALKAAYVSIAPASASDVGQTAADLVFMGDRLMPVATAIKAARRTMAVVRQNFVLAIGYNLLAVPLAIAGQVTPLVAALAMSGSSLIVVANALRLRSAAR